MCFHSFSFPSEKLFSLECLRNEFHLIFQSNKLNWVNSINQHYKTHTERRSYYNIPPGNWISTNFSFSSFGMNETTNQTIKWELKSIEILFKFSCEKKWFLLAEMKKKRKKENYIKSAILKSNTFAHSYSFIHKRSVPQIWLSFIFFFLKYFVNFEKRKISIFVVERKME